MATSGKDRGGSAGSAGMGTMIPRERQDSHPVAWTYTLMIPPTQYMGVYVVRLQGVITPGTFDISIPIVLWGNL